VTTNWLNSRSLVFRRSLAEITSLSSSPDMVFIIFSFTPRHTRRWYLNTKPTITHFVLIIFHHHWNVLSSTNFLSNCSLLAIISALLWVVYSCLTGNLDPVSAVVPFSALNAVQMKNGQEIIFLCIQWDAFLNNKCAWYVNSICCR